MALAPGDLAGTGMVAMADGVRTGNGPQVAKAHGPARRVAAAVVAQSDVGMPKRLSAWRDRATSDHGRSVNGSTRAIVYLNDSGS